MGAGKEPIWRLHEYNENATKLHKRDVRVGEDLPGLRYGTVRKAEEFGEAHVGCIEVADNHNFLLSDGTVVANCDRLIGVRLAELWLANIMASPYLIPHVNETGGTTYHAVVLHPDKTSEDCSLICGMGGAARARDRAEEIRKNYERRDNLLKAAASIVVEDGGDPDMLGAAVDAAGFVPRGGYAQ
jgi:hypothetical protein